LFYTSNNLTTPLFPDTLRAKYIGSYNTNNYFMKGYLDGVRIYNRALSANEVSEIYNQTKEKYQQ